MVAEYISREDRNSNGDISKYAAKASSYDALSKHQISQFFKHHQSALKTDCDRMAADILNAPVSPTGIQGTQSYTVAPSTGQSCRVVQFRRNKLDAELVGLVRLSYREFVPACDYQGTLKDIHVYVWDLVAGPAFCQVRRDFLTPGPGMVLRLGQTVQDFARFSASAWINRSNVENPSSSLNEEECSRILDDVSRGLPQRLVSKLDEVREGLPLIFRPDYPKVVQHDDFLENNFHVNEATGHITGVVDWADALVAPFGVSLGGLEIILGVQTSSRWHFHPHHIELRKQFWETFYKEIGQVSADDRCAIKIARLFGLFRTYGLEGDARTAYLDALCIDAALE